MSRRLVGRVLGCSMLALLLSCGSSAGDPGPIVGAETIDFSGRWEIRENSTVYESYSAACPAGDSSALHTYTVTQAKNVITIGTPYGTFNGIVIGDTIEWSGTFFNQRNNRWTTFDSLKFRFVDGGEDFPDMAIGENVFEHFEDLAGPGLRLCRGFSDLSAVRVAD